MEEPVSPAFEHRFLVRTAEEAVRAIRERLGESAEVVSVRRETRAGLGRWFRPARLEVIARVSPAVDQGLALPSLEAGSRPATPWDDPEEVGVAAPRGRRRRTPGLPGSCFAWASAVRCSHGCKATHTGGVSNISTCRRLWRKPPRCCAANMPARRVRL